MNDDKLVLTKEGLAKIKEELRSLQEETRPKVVERLALARQQGDLSENQEYTAARDELAFVDGRIEELIDILDKSVVVKEKTGPKGVVDIGCKVKVKNGQGEHVYHIVGEWEANPAEKKVSHSSPLGKALMGRKVGEEVEFEAPAGKILFNILGVE
jgi:transcription elongation factor GreA